MIHNAIPNVGTTEGEALLEAGETSILAISKAIGTLESQMSERMGSDMYLRAHDSARSDKCVPGKISAEDETTASG